MAKFAGSLDSSVLLRLLLNDVPEQHEAAVGLLESSRHPFAVADMALAELVYALEHYYQFKRPVIQESITALVSLPSIHANRALVEGALPLFVKHSNVSFEECCLQVYAGITHSSPLWTFDKKLTARLPGVRQVTHLDASLSYEMV